MRPTAASIPPLSHRSSLQNAGRSKRFPVPFCALLCLFLLLFLHSTSSSLHVSLQLRRGTRATEYGKVNRISLYLSLIVYSIPSHTLAVRPAARPFTSLPVWPPP